MATYRDLQDEVKEMNEKYCKKGRVEMRVQRAYGGYQVQLVSKYDKKGRPLSSLGSGCASITSGFDTAKETLADLYKSNSKGWLVSDIKFYNKKK
jgi:hypothetical protein